MSSAPRTDADAPERHTLVCDDGARIVLRRYPKPGRPRLLLSHGNGFGIDGYRKFWELLRDDYEIVVFDQRSHGRNPLHDIEHHSIAAMARDHLVVQREVEAAFGQRPTAGLFHSVSSIAAIVAARDHGAQWDALILYDPPLIAPPGHPLRSAGQGVDEFLAGNARKRRHRFDSVEELADEYRARVARHWVEGAALDMADGTVRPSEGGGVELSCPGEYEARIYLDNMRIKSWDALGSVQKTTFILGADPDTPRPLAPAKVGPLAAAAFGIAHVVVPRTGHMLQVEKPLDCVRETKAFLRMAGLT